MKVEAVKLRTGRDRGSRSQTGDVTFAESDFLFSKLLHAVKKGGTKDNRKKRNINFYCWRHKYVTLSFCHLSRDVRKHSY